MIVSRCVDVLIRLTASKVLDFGKILLGFGALGVFLFLLSGQSLDELAHDTGMSVLSLSAVAGAIGLWKLIRS